MKKSIHILVLTILLSVFLLTPVTVQAKTPEIMSALKSHIQTYGPVIYNLRSGSDVYTSKISYQKSKKRFLFQCACKSGNSTSSIKTYMPISKKKASYTVYFDETVRAAGKTAKISGSAKLKRKTYSDRRSILKFSRKNKTSVSKKIKNKAYQAAANAMLRTSVDLWELGLETKTTLCFRNFGFQNITVFDKRTYYYKW